MFIEFLLIIFVIFTIMLGIIINQKNKLIGVIKNDKIIKEKLNIEKAKLDEMLSIIPIPILITNNETRKIVFANRYSSIQYNIPEKDLIGMSITDLYVSDKQGETILNAMPESIPMVNFETIFKLSNGKEIDALLSLIPIEYNNQPCRIGSISDITDIKNTQKELIYEKERALGATKAKSQFLANMSHEIRTPLNGILGFVDILKEDITDTQNKEYLNIIDNSSHHLLGIIEDILDFSKIESGKLEIENIDFNTTNELQSTIDLFKAKASEKNISLEISIDKDIPKYLNSDPLRIKQVISNLLSNAIKFTPNGKKIFIDINYKDENLNISVKDQGIGVNKDNLSHIFDSFTQENSSTTREFGGTGLGLSISNELVKLLGGEIKVTSEIGIGSEFYFSIPIKLGLAKIDEKVKNEIEDKDIKLNGKILVVEDNKANQVFMKVILQKIGLQFDIASDGIEAIEQFKNNKYDAILMDENMPNMNGIEATRQILNIEKENNLNHTPIIALTANALKGDRERFLSAGMDEYLTKPLNKIILNKVLNKFIKTF